MSEAHEDLEVPENRLAVEVALRWLVLAVILAVAVACKSKPEYPPCEDQSCCEVRRSTYMEQCSRDQDEVYSCGHAANDVYQECMDSL